MRLKHRVGQLEAQQAPRSYEGKPFLWFAGQSLEQALSATGLTLADKPLFAIRIIGPNGCPLHDRDMALLD